MTDQHDLGDSGDAVIRCDGVVKRFGALVALDHLDLRIHRGTVVGYVGPNGSGKSTTIRILMDLARPDAGAVSVLGRDPRRSGPSARGRIGYLPGELRLDDRLGVDETLRSWAAIRGRSVEWTRVEHLCERLDLDPTRRNRTLSSGNRRKVGLVGAFMARPELLILDEPTAGVDPLVQAEFTALVGEARAEGATVFLSSHVLSEVQRLADDVIVIRGGRVVAEGTVDELRRQALQPFTVWFAADAPVDELARLPSVGELEIRHGNEARGVLTGGPGELLSLLARHEVIHVVLPEPDLEQAFLRYYSTPDEDVGTDVRTSTDRGVRW